MKPNKLIELLRICFENKEIFTNISCLEMMQSNNHNQIQLLSIDEIIDKYNSGSYILFWSDVKLSKNQYCRLVISLDSFFSEYYFRYQSEECSVEKIIEHADNDLKNLLIFNLDCLR